MLRILAIGSMALLLAPAAWAQPSGKAENATKIDARRLPKGLSQQKAERLLAHLDDLSEKERQREERKTQERADKIQEIAGPARKRLKATLEGDAGLAKRWAAYEADLKAALDPEISESERSKRLAKLEADHEPLVQEALAKSGFDEQKYRRDVQKALGLEGYGHKDVVPRATGDYLRWSSYGSFRLISTYKAPPSQPAEIEYKLEPPFPFEQIRKRGNSTATADKAAGSYRARSFALVVGGHTNEAGLGHFVETPSGYTKVEVAAALPETGYRGFSGAFAGYSHAEARSRIEVLSENVIACRRSITHFFIVAPVAWYASEQGTDNVVVSCEFDAPPAGEEIVVRFTGDASVLAIAGGESEAFVNATPRDIKVKFRR